MYCTLYVLDNMHVHASSALALAHKADTSTSLLAAYMYLCTAAIAYVHVHRLYTHLHVCSHTHTQHEAIVTQVRNFIDTHQVVCAGPFIYAYVEEVESSPYRDLFLVIADLLLILLSRAHQMSSGFPSH